MNNNTAGECGYRQGSLPECAPLAVAYVPMQSSAEPSYKPNEALSRGTLFPGLDLPFKNIVNAMPGDTPALRELQALQFVCFELLLYLDTHKNDAEAFSAWKTTAKLKEEAMERYVAKNGPLTHMDLLNEETFTWLSDPWPWEYCAQGGAK